MSSNLIIGLNPALQKRLVLPTALRPGNVHRVTDVSFGIGGKGQDVAVALSCLSIPTNLLQFVGGDSNGDQILTILGETYSVRDDWTMRVTSPMRVCTTLISGTEATELVEPSGLVTPGEFSAMMDLVSTGGGGNGEARGITAAMDAVCVMGSMPPGCPTDAYAKIVDKCCSKKGFILMDTVIGLKPLMGVLGGGKHAMLKVNFSELCRLVGMEAFESSSQSRTTLEIDHAVLQFIKKFDVQEGSLSFMAITDGKNPAFFVNLSNLPARKIWKMETVALQTDGDGNVPLLYPIGAGDAVAAGTIAAWQIYRKAPHAVEETLKKLLFRKYDEWVSDGDIDDTTGMAIVAFGFGLACGSASCLQCENSVLQVRDVEKLFSLMKCPSLVTMF